MSNAIPIFGLENPTLTGLSVQYIMYKRGRFFIAVKNVHKSNVFAFEFFGSPRNSISL